MTFLAVVATSGGTVLAAGKGRVEDVELVEMGEGIVVLSQRTEDGGVERVVLTEAQLAELAERAARLLPVALAA